MRDSFKIHKLKTWPGPFAAAKSGIKTHEVRKDDRHFEEGDVLILQEYDNDWGLYSGDEITRLVTYKTVGFGLPEGLTVLSIKPCELVKKSCASCHEGFRTPSDEYTYCGNCL